MSGFALESSPQSLHAVLPRSHVQISEEVTQMAIWLSLICVAQKPWKTGIEAMGSAYTESRSTPLHVTHLQIAIRVLRPST
ncbi:hypothetical protein IG631_07996 [Alternaria alternata]|nr:hypothetical protein IG631_07996 [Alternaria alternata]